MYLGIYAMSSLLDLIQNCVDTNNVFTNPDKYYIDPYLLDLVLHLEMSVRKK